jgi:tetratricopeptide (TPR) repeat protein
MERIINRAVDSPGIASLKWSLALHIFSTAFLLCLLPGAAYSQDSGAAITQEYFVRQAADEALLVRIDGFEAEFVSTLSDEAGGGILQSGIRHSRIAPVFQFVAQPGASRQLGIEVTSTAQTSRSRFELGLTRLTVWDERSNAVAHAYRLLSFGMQTPPVDTESAWTGRVTSLTDAARLFQQYGMNEMRLWSRYLAAHLIQYRLQDYSIAYRLSREILDDMRVTRVADIELAARELLNDALIGLKRKHALPVAGDGGDPVQASLARTAAFAESMGATFAQANALALSGAEYALDGMFSEALEQYELAIALADAVGDAGLSKLVRERVVEIHTREGNAPATSEVLQQLETQLAVQGDGDELALNLLAQGRLLIDQHRYGEARDVLAEALGYQDHSAIRKQVELELARVFYETGRFDQALEVLQVAGVRAADHDRKRPNSVLENGAALGLLADVQRNRGALAEMRAARAAQGLYAGNAAAYLYQQGLDALAGQDTNRARDRFQRTVQAARRVGDEDLADLSLLRLCSINDGCGSADAASAYQRLLASGAPRLVVEAMFLNARIQAGEGKAAEAVRTLEATVEEIHFLRHALPGALGAWYHENHADLSDFYLGLLLLAPQTGGDASASLLALTRLRLLETYDTAGAKPGTEAQSRLRVQLAERTWQKPGEKGAALVAEITMKLEALRQPFREQFAYLSAQGIGSYLADLGRDEVLLTWHIGENSAHAWAGRKGRVVRRSITRSIGLGRKLGDATATVAGVSEATFRSEMESLGRALLEPVADLLAPRIYWIPAGPMLGLPLGALRLEGRYLAEKHSVAAVLSFPARPDPATDLPGRSIGSVFLAGNPQDYSSAYASRFETTDEMRAMVDLFVGPDLHVVQGAALLPDEFQDQRFAQAGIVHLAMPGVIDLRNPQDSSLELSGSEFGPRRTPYRLEGVGPGSLEARLVFLSSTRLANRPGSAFSATPGLAADFTRAGAAAVVADLWATEGAADRAFLVQFYNGFLETGDAAQALQSAKRQYIGDNGNSGLFGWAGYQLYIP